jgi:hypothetical protein
LLGAGSLQVQRWPALGGPSTDWMKYRRRKKLTAEQGLALLELCPSVARAALVPRRGAGPRRLVIARDGYVPSVVEQAPVHESIRILITLVPVGAKAAGPTTSASAKAKAPSHRPSGGRHGPKPPSDINMNR